MLWPCQHRVYSTVIAVKIFRSTMYLKYRHRRSKDETAELTVIEVWVLLAQKLYQARDRLEERCTANVTCARQQQVSKVLTAFLHCREMHKA